MPKISVIIPVYNVENELAKCLNSIVNQTFKEIEIICVDDGSTDNSLNILKDYANKDSRFRIFEQKNQGAGIARNIALNQAQGDYIAFVDGDDYIDLNFLESMYKVAIDNNLDIVKGNFLIHESNGSIINTHENERIEKELLNNKIPHKDFLQSWWSALYKNSVIKDYGIQFAPIRYLEDVPFLHKFLAVASSFQLKNDVFYHYVIRDNSTCHEKLTYEKKIFMYDNWFSNNENILEFLNKVSISKDVYLKIFYYQVYGASIFFNLKNIIIENLVDDYTPYINRIFSMVDKCKYDFFAYGDSSYINNSKKYIKKKNYDGLVRYIKNISKNKEPLVQKIFSIKHENMHNVLSILGIKIKIRKGSI